MAQIDENYTEKSIVVHNDTMDEKLQNMLIEAGGLQKTDLKKFPFRGFIFPKFRLKDVKSLISGYEKSLDDEAKRIKSLEEEIRSTIAVRQLRHEEQMQNEKQRGEEENQRLRHMIEKDNLEKLIGLSKGRIYSGPVIIGDKEDDFYRGIRGKNKEDFTPQYFSWNIGSFVFPVSEYSIWKDFIILGGVKYKFRYHKGDVDFRFVIGNKEKNIQVTFSSVCIMDDFCNDDSGECLLEGGTECLNDAFHPGLDNITECIRIFVNFMEKTYHPGLVGVWYRIPSEMRIVIEFSKYVLLIK